MALSSVDSRWFWPAMLVLVAAVGCGGGNEGPKDGGHDGDVDATLDVSGDIANDVGADVGMDLGGDVAGDTATDVIDATDATDGSPIMDAATEEGPPPVVMLTVDALQNSIVLDRCTGLMPASLVDVPAGAHTMALTASTLSKGSVSGPNDELIPSFDDFVLVNVPVAAGESASRRFFTLNGVGATANFTLSALGTLKLMFIDSDATANTGQGTVALDTTGPTAVVDAALNVLPYSSGCFATAVSLSVSDRPHRATLTESTLSAGRRTTSCFCGCPVNARWIRSATSS
jgi:hypothetical protein